MSSELVVSIKDSEGKTIKKPFLIYEDFTWSEKDPVIMQCVKELLEEFKGEVEDIKVRALMVIK